nr:zinc finger BED domain-containing protein RICESLEEPER 2-like [Tanacetum cinerariifolium]
MSKPAQTINNLTIRSILEKEKHFGLNFLDWYRNQRIVLEAEHKLVHMETPTPNALVLVVYVNLVAEYTKLLEHNIKDLLCMLGGAFYLMWTSYMIVVYGDDLSGELEVKNILKYLRNIKDMFVVYGGDLDGELEVTCYTNAGFETDRDDIKISDSIWEALGWNTRDLDLIREETRQKHKFLSSRPPSRRGHQICLEILYLKMLCDGSGNVTSEARSKDKRKAPVIDVDSENVNQRVDEHIDERGSDQVDEKKGRFKNICVGSFVWDHFPRPKEGATETTCPYCSTVLAANSKQNGTSTLVTVDNASSNDEAIRRLRIMLNGPNAILDCKYLHLRCCAHIINLVIRDGLEEQNSSICKIRNAVKYLRSSSGRQESFENDVKFEKVDYKRKPCLDVDTRWNSTFLMLETTVKFEKVFDRLELTEHMPINGLPLEEMVENSEKLELDLFSNRKNNAMTLLNIKISHKSAFSREAPAVVRSHQV